MTDLIIGSGSVGTFIAWALATGGRDVAIVRRRHQGPPEAAEVTIVDRGGDRHVAQVTQVARPADLSHPPALLVFAVKQFDLGEAVATCSVWPEAVSLTVANGVGAEQVVAEARPGGGLIAGSVTVSLEPAAAGAVVRLNDGGIGLAAVRGDVPSVVDALLDAFRAAQVRTEKFADPAAMKWSKLVANLVGNATSAILDVSPATVYSDGRSFAIERRQLREALAVMARLRLRVTRLPGANVPLLALATRLPAWLGRPIMSRVVGGARGGKDPSLRVHVRSGSGPSEVEWLNGAVARAAMEFGGRAEINRRLAELVGEVIADPDRRTWFRGRPDRLVEALSASGPARAIAPSIDRVR